MSLQPYLISLAIGVGVGVVYGLLDTRSPAPPIIALLGLLGMLAGESLTGWAKKHLTAEEAAVQCLHNKSFAHDRSTTAVSESDQT